MCYTCEQIIYSSLPLFMCLENGANACPVITRGCSGGNGTMNRESTEHRHNPRYQYSQCLVTTLDRLAK